jgi:DNA excision repair protein ERCC-3
MPHDNQYPLEEIISVIDELHDQQPFVTTSDVAGVVGCSRETARTKLHELVDEGALESQKVGARAMVWYDPRFATHRTDSTSDVPTPVIGAPNAEETDTESQDQVPATSQTDGEEDERILFFPSRREVVIDSPTDRSQRTLTQTAHLVDSTGDGYLYKIDQVDIWNAPYDSFKELRRALLELIGDDMWDGGFESRIKDDWDRANQFRLFTHHEGYAVLEATDPEVFENVAKRKLEYGEHYSQFISDTQLRVTNGNAAAVKEELYDAGYPVTDERRLEEGSGLDVELSNEIQLRDYQMDWVEQFSIRRNGVFVGPSGSGKTIAAIGAMAAIGGETLIIVPNRELAQQWEDELIETTTLMSRQIGQYHGGSKQIRPVTVVTYDTASMSRHRELFNERDWGLVIADECHHSAASTWKRFREIQSKARLGLSATPVREAQDSKTIYTLIGPPIGADWGSLFAEGWVEKPDVKLIPVPWDSKQVRNRYQRASGSKQQIEAARNPKKQAVIRSLLENHEGEKTLIFVDWIKQGKELAEHLELPFVCGETDHSDREDFYDAFRTGELKALIISRVGDEGIDLPDAEVAILASTMGSSRSQTGQRAGRTMRPLGNASVYILLTKGSGEEDWGRESTQYLAEKGVDVTKIAWEDV